MSSVVIGVGNRYRCDDAVGLLIAEEVRARIPSGVAVVVCEEEPSRLIDDWREAATAIVVDAVVSPHEPGTVRRFDATTEELPAESFRSSTHAFGVAETIELARALGRLPQRLLVYGVAGADFRAGAVLTPAVREAVEGAVEAILRDIEEGRCTSGH
jgi:hydrogenase maturation protease